MTAEVEEWQRFKTLNQVAAYSSNIQYIPFFLTKPQPLARSLKFTQAKGGQWPPPLYTQLKETFETSANERNIVYAFI